MAGSFLGMPRVQYFETTTGQPLSGGLLYSYEAGVGNTTPRATYPTLADATAGTNANANPVVLDSRGEAAVVISGATRLVLKRSNGTTIWSVDAVGTTGSDVIDPNGNNYLTFTSTTGAVNYLNITNASTGTSPILSVVGGDTNIGLNLTLKGSGSLAVTSSATTISGTLAVAGISTLTGNVSTSGTLAVTGAVTASSTLAVTGASTLTGAVTANAALSFIPVGTVVWKASATVPTNWLECDGSAVSRATYAALFADIGTTYGTGDGSTTFNLPNQQRRALVGRGGSGTATLANTLGSTGGEETHLLTTPEIPAHTHTYQAQITVSQGQSSGNSILAASSGSVTGSTGGGGSHNNMQPSLVMMMIIRAI